MDLKYEERIPLKVEKKSTTIGVFALLASSRVMLLAIAHYFIWFTAIQLWTQAVSLAIIQMIAGSNCIVEALRIALGLTGDNSPKKKHIADDKWISFSYFAIAFAIAFSPEISAYLCDFPWTYSVAATLLLNALHCIVLRLSGVFILFKFYDGGKGFGFNLYFWGWRKIGLDWHAFQVRQDLVTGKPLKPHEQYFMNRPHIDLPDWNLHHWPWAQNQSHEEMQTIMESKAELRKAREEAKAAKRARREKALAERAASSEPVTPTASNAPSPTLPAREEAAESEETAAGLFD